MANSDLPKCGWQVPGNVPDAFDWWLFGIVSAAVAASAYIYANGIPVISGIIKLLGGIGSGAGTVAPAVGALAVLGLVVYYLLRPDGCIRSKPKSEPVCCSGLVEQVTDKSSTATLILAPYALGPSYIFDLVVKSQYLYLISQEAEFIICSSAQVPLLRCVVKSKISCAARIGATVGAVIGGIGGIILGYMAGAAIASLSCGIFAWLCFILALIIAAIVAAAVTYAGAMAGGSIAGGFASIGDDQIEETAKSLTPGAIVTVRGDWTKNPDSGYNELFYVTAVYRTGQSSNSPPFTINMADETPPDDCPLAPPPIE